MLMRSPELEIPDFEVSEARYSQMALMPLRFAYIDYRSIGVHEPPREANTRAVYDSITEIGYHGPAISTFFTYSDERLVGMQQIEQLDEPYGTVGGLPTVTIDSKRFGVSMKQVAYARRSSLCSLYRHMIRFMCSCMT